MKDSIRVKMQAEGLDEAAINAFAHCLDALHKKADMMIAEADIEPVRVVDEWDSLIVHTPEADAALLAQSVIIKLNGGLGTSMGLKHAKSLLTVKDGLNFLDITARQVLHLRERFGVKVRMLILDSFSTAQATMDHLQRYAQHGLADAGEVQLASFNKIPKLCADTLSPICSEEHPQLAWCPPGHGDLYPSLLGSGWLDKLLDEGVKYAFISNSDNLGAQMDTRFLNWFAQSNSPFVMEVTRRSCADKKGGHLARRRRDGQLLLREVAQCRDEDMSSFQDIERHRFFNTNSLWIRLDKLRDLLHHQGGVIPLPVIRNKKTLDPRDPSTPPVYQLEVAMGAAITCFAQARAVQVPRSRFFPVKTCSDLLLMRSDAVQIDAHGAVSLAPECQGRLPLVELDKRYYKLIDSLRDLGLPSLKNVSRLVVKGVHQFQDNEPLSGEVYVG